MCIIFGAHDRPELQYYNLYYYYRYIIFAYIIAITYSITRPLDRNIQFPHLSSDKPPQNTTCCRRCNGYAGNVQFKISLEERTTNVCVVRAVPVLCCRVAVYNIGCSLLYFTTRFISVFRQVHLQRDPDVFYEHFKDPIPDAIIYQIF